MTEPPPYEPDLLLGTLERHGVRYVVIGGLAAELHGSPYATDDVDVTPSRDRENLTRLIEALQELDAKIRVPEGEPRPEMIWEPDFIERFQNLALTTRHGNLDVCLSPDGTRGYADLERQATKEAVSDTLQVSVASLADVIRSKDAAGRQKDRLHLPVLRELLERQRPEN